MNNRNYYFVFLLAVTLMLGSSVELFAQKSIELKYNLKVGDQFTNETNIEQTIQFEAMGQKVTLDQDMTFYMASSVDAVKEDSITQSTSFERIVMDQQIFGMEIKYDSDDSSTFNSPMGTAFADQMNKLINAQVIAIMNDRGQIKDMDLSALGSAGELSGGLNTGNNYAVYPDHKIKVGDSWEEDIEPMKNSNMTVKVTYVLSKASRKEAIISLDGVLSANITNPEADGELAGTMKGEMTINRKNGMVKKSNIQMDMTMNVDQNGTKFPAVVSSFIDTEISNVK